MHIKLLIAAAALFLNYIAIDVDPIVVDKAQEEGFPIFRMTKVVWKQRVVDFASDLYEKQKPDQDKEGEVIENLVTNNLFSFYFASSGLGGLQSGFDALFKNGKVFFDKSFFALPAPIDTKSEPSC